MSSTVVERPITTAKIQLVCVCGASLNAEWTEYQSIGTSFDFRPGTPTYITERWWNTHCNHRPAPTSPEVEQFKAEASQRLAASLDNFRAMAPEKKEALV